MVVPFFLSDAYSALILVLFAVLKERELRGGRGSG